MNGPGAIQGLAVNPADEREKRATLGQGTDVIAVRQKGSSHAGMHTGSGHHWAFVLIGGLSNWVLQFVQRSSAPEPSMRMFFDEANLTLESIQHDLKVSLCDGDATNWDELSQQLDRVNDLLRSVVEHLPDTGHGCENPVEKLRSRFVAPAAS